MTDLEKAIEIARKHDELFGIRKREECCVAACQEMAEWKKQQMIDKACEWLKKKTVHTYTQEQAKKHVWST